MLITVARFPNGSWTTGGRPHSPDYETCYVWRIEAPSEKVAIKRAQGRFARLKRKHTPAGEPPAVIEREPMESSEFLRLSKIVLGKAELYRDPMLIIKRQHDGGLEITRQPLPHCGDHLTGTNPVTMADAKGDVYRHHGEHVWLSRHLQSLAGVAAG